VDSQTLMGAFLGAVLLFVIFLIARELMCWYWKINRVVSLLEENNRLLRANVQVVAAPSPTKRAEVASQLDYEADPDYDPNIDDADALDAATKAAMRASR
jgi:hypothetical protein